MILQLLRLCLRNADVQNTVLKLCLHIGFGNSITDIEASLHCTGVTLLTDQLALLSLFVLVKTLCGTDSQITVLKLKIDLKSGNLKKSSNKFSPKMRGYNIGQSSFLLVTLFPLLRARGRRVQRPDPLVLLCSFVLIIL